MSVDIDLKEQTWAGVNKMSVPLEGGGRQVFSLGGGTPTLQTKTVTYTPTTSQQTDTISPDSGYDGLSLVNVIVNAMQGGADVPTFTLSGVQDGSTVTCDKTYAEVRALYDDGLLVALANAPTYNCVYAMSICDEPGSSSLRYAVYDANGYPMGDVLITSSAMTYSVPSVTQKTMNLPTATKGTVTNHTMTIGVGVTNSRGFYASGVTRGNPIYVSASELVSGSETKTANGTYDVTNLAELVVNVSSGSDIPTFTVDTSTSPASVTCNKTYSECRTLYTNGDASGVATILPYNLKVTASVWDSDSSYLKYCLFNGYGYPVADLTYISSGITYSEPSGLVGIEGTPTATKGTVSNHSVSVTPSVTNSAGYISGGTKTGNAVTVTATELASGNLPITQNADNINVVGYASVSVNVPSGIGTLLATKSLGTISTNSTTATDTGQTVSVSGINGYDLLVVETSVNTKTNGRHASTMQCIWLTASSTIGTKSGSAIATATMNVKLSSSGTATSRSNTTKYGIYVNSVSISNGSATLTMYQRYNNTQTGTINGSYTTRVYGVNLYDLIGG